jgi:hypothetical protein
MNLKDILTIGIGSAALAIGLVQYHYTSQNEFLKPIRETQLKLYVDASSAAASLATLPVDSKEWKDARADFLRLFYGPMAIVENYESDPGQSSEAITVERAMIAFKECLDDASCEKRNYALALAHTCRVSLGTSWGFDYKELEGKYQNLIRSKPNSEKAP